MKNYVSTGTRNEAAAKAALKEALRKEELAKEGRNTLRQYIEPFYDYERCPHIQRIGQKSISKKSARIIRSYIKNHVLADPIADMTIYEIKTRDITAFRARLQKKMVMSQPKKDKNRNEIPPVPIRPLSSGTIDKIMNAVKTVFGEAVINRDIPYNPCVGIVRLGSNYDNPRGAFSIDELRILLRQENWNNTEAWNCFRLVAVTGMRCGEVLALPWGCVSEQELAIVNNWKDIAEKGEPKGNKPRTVPISRSAWCIISEHKATRNTMLDDDDLIFCDPETGRRHSAQWWKKNFDSAMKKSKLPLYDSDGHKRTPHSLRHTLNTLLLMQGASPIIIREYLGWSEDSNKLTKVQRGYTHFSVTDMKGLVDTIDRVFEPIIKKDAEK
jgi:integrase